MTKKPGSLRMPDDPLAAMRELQELDAPPRPGQADNATSSPVADATGNEIAPATGSAVAKTTSSQVGSATGSVSEHLDNDATALPVASATGSVDYDTTGSKIVNATGSPVAKTTRSGRRRATGNGESHATGSRAANATGSAGKGLPEDPLKAAMLAMLERPYTGDPARGPFTVTTVKIPTEVWERLGWVASLLDRPKQDVIAEALKAYFETVRRQI